MTGVGWDWVPVAGSALVAWVWARRVVAGLKPARPERVVRTPGTYVVTAKRRSR